MICYLFYISLSSTKSHNFFSLNSFKMYKILLLLSLAFLGYLGFDYSQEVEEEPTQIASIAAIPPFREVVYLTAEHQERTKGYYSLNSEPPSVIGCRCLQNGISNYLLPFEVGWRS